MANVPSQGGVATNTASGEAKTSPTGVVTRHGGGIGSKPADKPAANPAVSTASPFKISRVRAEEKWLKAMIYANYGVGKTHLAGTAADVPTMRNILFLNAESGHQTLVGGENEELYIDQAPLTTFRQFSDAHKFLTQHCALRDAINKADREEQLKKLQSMFTGEDIKDIDAPRIYRTVVIDSLSEVEQYCMQQLLGVRDSMSLAQETASAEWSEYKQNNTMILRLCRAFRNLPMHVIFLSAEQYVQDENKKMKYTPALTGKLSKQVQGFMDLVGYMVMGQPTQESERQGFLPRRMYVQPSTEGRFDAKHRFRNFKGSYIDNPTLERILTAASIPLE